MGRPEPAGGSDPFEQRASSERHLKPPPDGDSPPEPLTGGKLTAIRGRRLQILRTAHRPKELRVLSAVTPSLEQPMTDHVHSDEISTLNTLIATTIDSVTGYENSAKDIENERFAQIFRERASERQQVVEQLRSEVRRLGGNPEDDGSFLGKTHQRFEDLKAAITGQDEKSIVNEVERGEDYIKGKFETALNADTLSGESRAVVEQCYQSIRSGHDQMSQLKHGLETNA
jgi:uncharacterized protein (TIGR02284 family)